MHLLDDSTCMRGMSDSNWNIFNETRERCVSESESVLWRWPPPIHSERISNVISSKRAWRCGRERGLRASAEGIRVRISPRAHDCVRASWPRAPFPLSKQQSPLEQSPCKRACPHSCRWFAVGSWTWQGPLFLVVSPVLDACHLGEGKVSAWLGWLAVLRGA